MATGLVGVADALSCILVGSHLLSYVPFSSVNEYDPGGTFSDMLILGLLRAPLFLYIAYIVAKMKEKAELKLVKKHLFLFPFVFLFLLCIKLIFRTVGMEH